MRVLVTGAGGFIGGHVVTELLGRGHAVTAMIRPGSAVPAGLSDARVKLLRADLRRPPEDLAQALAACDAVIHLAAGTKGGWRAALDTMVAGTEHLLEAVREAGWRGRFVHVSSFAVYGFNQLRPGAVVDERAPLEPTPWRRDVYAWGKALQERVVRQARDAGELEATVVRPGAVYGPERRFQYRLGRPLGARALVLFGGGNRLPLTYVENLASLLATCAEHPAAAGQELNAVDTADVTQRAYARRWARAQPGRVAVVPVPVALLSAAGHALRTAGRLTDGRLGPPGMLDPYILAPMFRRFDFRAERARELLGWTPPVPVEEALRRTFSAART